MTQQLGAPILGPHPLNSCHGQSADRTFLLGRTTGHFYLALTPLRHAPPSNWKSTARPRSVTLYPERDPKSEVGPARITHEPP